MLECECFMAQVRYRPSVRAAYLRVSVPQRGGIPLSLKATFGRWKNHHFEKDDWVEVERTDPRDARRYRVVRLFKDKSLALSFLASTYFDDGRNEMSMSHDRVKFYFNRQYFCSANSPRQEALNLLRAAFDMQEKESRELMCQNGEGFYIVCRPSQFARFLIWRNEAGMTNGFKDLMPELIPGERDPLVREIVEVWDRPHQSCYSPRR